MSIFRSLEAWSCKKAINIVAVPGPTQAVIAGPKYAPPKIFKRRLALAQLRGVGKACSGFSVALCNSAGFQFRNATILGSM
jgi:hypothetical protein